MSDGAKLLLIGMMGAGKTTAGRYLAERLGWRYVDSDSQVREETGRTVPELFAERGEAAFRAAEAAALRSAVGGPGPAVVSVAGGAVLDAENRRVISSAGPVVWLRAEPATLAARVGDGSGRPLLGDDPPSVLRRLDAVRRPLYEGLADVVVDVDDLTPEAVAERVLAATGLGDGAGGARRGGGGATG
ncbi:MAG: shikimate kinase [Acidimicrobiales bacterium]